MPTPIDFSSSAQAWLDANPHAASQLVEWFFALAEQPDRSLEDEQLGGYLPPAHQAVLPLGEDGGNLSVIYVRFPRRIKILQIEPEEPPPQRDPY